MKITDKQIIKTATINATANDVWHSWTTAEGIAAFLDVRANMKLERGGPFELYFDDSAALGLQGSEGCVIISFVPLEMLSFTWNAPPTIPYVRNHEYKTWVTLFFSETIDGTNLRLVHTGWPEGEEWDKTYKYFDNAWGNVLKVLEAHWEKN
jgi:uncharacterized protein YndB with AHSA1/START domain